ncbi:hypothetical protein B0I35DRAFT_433089 [Stachybotrys elegans]|uniref:Secreted protein n=1 Tax=Stachybotrys elegans TaxID=80388 RepID=A0A8K0SP93_9HYPO|nr:hypothetical protein B0I35DRAFT_433089 [Stachybotrys elegans]
MRTVCALGRLLLLADSVVIPARSVGGLGGCTDFSHPPPQPSSSIYSSNGANRRRRPPRSRCAVPPRMHTAHLNHMQAHFCILQPPLPLRFSPVVRPSPFWPHEELHEDERAWRYEIGPTRASKLFCGLDIVQWASQLVHHLGTNNGMARKHRLHIGRAAA